MPIYEYLCTDCGTRFDTIRSINKADDPVKCKKCESLQTKRMISIFYAQSNGKSLVNNSGGCSHCSGGSCGSCSH